MATEKTAYTAVDGGPSPLSLPGQSAFPGAFDMNVPGSTMFGGPTPGGFPAPGGVPFPPPSAFGGPGAFGPGGHGAFGSGGPGAFGPGGPGAFSPGGPGAYGPGGPGAFDSMKPQGGPGYGPNPSSPYFAPGQSGNFNGWYCYITVQMQVCVCISYIFELYVNCWFQIMFTTVRKIHLPFMRIKILILVLITRALEELSFVR